MERVGLRRAALSVFGRDSEGPGELTAVHVCATPRRYLAGYFTSVDQEEWANLLECRDHLFIPQGPVLEADFDFANPVVQGELNRERETALLGRLVAGA